MAKTTDSESSRAALAAQFESSGMSRREFCERHGIPLTTLDYYRYRSRKKKNGPVRLLPLNMTSTGSTAIGDSVAVVFANGRRIEFSQPFTEAGLGQLVRTVEQA